MGIKLPKDQQDLTIYCVNGNSNSFLLKDIAENNNKPLIYVASNDINANNISKSLKHLLPDWEILSFPAWDCQAYDRISPNNQITCQRLFCLSRLIISDNPKQIIITTSKATITRTINQETIIENCHQYDVKYKVSHDEIIKKLIAANYERTETVNEAGEFAERGSIIDIFPSNFNKPVRLDFFGNEIESLKYFDPISQITTEACKELIITPASEVILNEKSISLFKTNYRNLFGIAKSDDLLFEAVSNNIKHIGIEHWLPLFYAELSDIFQYCPNHIIIEEQNLESANKENLLTIKDHYEQRLENTADNYNPIEIESLYLAAAELKNIKAKRQIIKFSQFDKEDGQYFFRTKYIPNFHDQSKLEKKTALQLLAEFISKESEKKEYNNIIITSANDFSLERLKNILNDHDLPAIISKEFPTKKNQQLTLMKLPIEHGFIHDDFILITEQDLLGQKIGHAKTRTKKIEKLLQEAATIEIDEFIVHKEHGIGQFRGISVLELNGKKHDFLEIIYANNDKLFVPVENIDLISRYGDKDKIVTLDNLSGKTWRKRKAKVKEQILAIAGELIEIAGKRALKKSPEFSNSDSLMQEFAAKFPYSETEDQITAIEHVTQDLKSGKVMDRLVCGDVGFGKTEIAMRAAFIILSNENKQKNPQIAIVIPTTLLARQHYKNFKERFSDFGLRIEQLSRMITAKKSKEIKQDLADGKVDIIIGTHALLADSIKFKNLALVIIDEEQHFGVKQKEKLKALKEDVNLLTLSATPIPRTLQMSLTGIRDLSLIATPPIDRMAVRSFVMPFDELVIKQAILREYHRGGQIFCICPRIKDLELTADKIAKIAPHIKHVVAHGQMPATKLDEIITDFYDGKYQILISTSIVESGIDIANANTLIVINSDKFGLSQLYQLRGRVGRSNIRAYAYFTISQKKILNKKAQKRLEVMQTLDGLGAGFSLASHDLDIRGAGNLLGSQQSGHVREVGVELYQDMLNEAIKQQREHNQKTQQEIDDAEYIPKINLGISIHINQEYIKDTNLRMEFYRRIGGLQSEAEAEEILFEMENRFGKIPEQVLNLVEIVSIKQAAKLLNIGEINAGPKAISVKFHNNKSHNPDKIMDLVTNNPIEFKIKPDQSLLLQRESENDLALISNIKKLFNQLS
jgi:transcription-repair coupling factor (superfamily II helicase)